MLMKKTLLFSCEFKVRLCATYDVPKAASVPFGISVEGARRSPLILMPDKTPVIVGKNIPKTRNQVYPSEYCDQKFDTKLSVLHPVKPFARNEHMP